MAVRHSRRYPQQSGSARSDVGAEVKSRGGPGSLVAFITMLGVVGILLIAVRQSDRSASFNQDALDRLAGIVLTSQATLDEVRAAVKASPDSTNKAILALINDNRRTHGCQTVASIEGLNGAPACNGRPTVVVNPTPAVTVLVPAPAPNVSSPAPAPAPTTASTTIPALRYPDHLICVLGICI